MDESTVFSVVVHLAVSGLILSLTIAANANEAEFLTRNTVQVEASRIFESAMLAGSIQGEIRIDMEGFSINYSQQDSSLNVYTQGIGASRDFEVIESGYSDVNAPQDKTEINDYVCVSSDSNQVFITVDRCR